MGNNVAKTLRDTRKYVVRLSDDDAAELRGLCEDLQLETGKIIALPPEPYGSGARSPWCRLGWHNWERWKQYEREVFWSLGRIAPRAL